MFRIPLHGRYLTRSPDRAPQTPITVHLINTGNEQLATGNSIRRRHERRKSRFNFIHGVKIPTRRFCTIGVYLEKSNLAQKHLVAVLSLGFIDLWIWIPVCYIRYVINVIAYVLDEPEKVSRNFTKLLISNILMWHDFLAFIQKDSTITGTHVIELSEFRINALILFIQRVMQYSNRGSLRHLLQSNYYKFGFSV